MLFEDSRNCENKTLPKKVRFLPKTVRFQNQGNALSLNRIYQGTTKKNVNDLDMEFWNNFEEYLVYRIGKVVLDVDCYTQNSISMLSWKVMPNRFLYYLIIKDCR